MLDYLLQIIPTIADGLKVTIALFCVVWVLSIPGGIILALLRLSKLPVVDKIVEAFVYLMRGTPLMLQILFMYFALPIMTDGAIQMDESSAVVFNPFHVVNTKGQRYLVLRMVKRCVPSFCHKCLNACYHRLPTKRLTY